MIGRDVRMAEDWLDGPDVEPCEIALCENGRFLTGEDAFGVTGQVSYVSTGGGALLEFLGVDGAG